MAEINNNIPSFGINSKKVDNKLNKDAQPSQQPVKDGEVDLGRDMLLDNVGDRSIVIKSPKKQDVAQNFDASVNQALAFMAENKELVDACEDVFDALVEQFQADGCSYEEACALATQGVIDEFAPVAKARAV